MNEAGESDRGYIIYSIEDGNTFRINESDALTSQAFRLIGLCGPNPQASASKPLGEDSLSAANIRENSKNLLLLAEADGVGMSYRPELASRRAVKFISEQGGKDLKRNLENLTESIKRLDPPKPDTDIALLNEALENKRKLGSSTTINQILIDKDGGKVKGLFHGDGYLAIVRREGKLEIHPCSLETIAPPQVSSHQGISGESKQFSDQLKPGDVIFLYSDGLDRVEASALKQAASLTRDVEDFQQTSKEIWQLIDSQNLRIDDRSLLIYCHA